MTTARVVEAPAQAPTAQGYKTSEFVVTIITIAANLIGAAAGWLPPEYAGIATAIAGGLYALSRSMTKTGVAKAEAMVLVAKQ
jgi:hypothetical protein